jgi:hypothetical protein
MFLKWRKSKASEKFTLMSDNDNVDGFDGILIPNTVDNFEMISVSESKPKPKPSAPVICEAKIEEDADVDLLFFGEHRPPPAIKPPHKSTHEKIKSLSIMPVKPEVCESIPVILLYKESGNVRFEGFINKDGLAIGHGTEFTDTPHLLPIYCGMFENGIYNGEGIIYDTKTNLKQTVGTFKNGRLVEGSIYQIKNDSIKIRMIFDGKCYEEHNVENDQMFELLAQLSIN